MSLFHTILGPEEFRAMRDQYILAGELFVIEFDVTNESSFKALQVYIDQIARAKDSEEVPPAPIVLCG